VLLKSVIEAIPVYWTSLAWVLKGVLQKITKLASRFLWAGKEDSKPLVLSSKKIISKPLVLSSKKIISKSKGSEGWGLKDIFTFTKSLAAKNY